MGIANRRPRMGSSKIRDDESSRLVNSFTNRRPFRSQSHRWLLRRLNELAAMRYNVIHDAVRLGFLGGHEAVAVDVALDLLDRTSGMLGHEIVHLAAQIDDLARLNLDVRGRS